MKVTWEAEDIIPGRRYSKPGIKEIWAIGFLAYESTQERYVSVSNQDGMVTEPKFKENFAADLTEQGYLPVELIPGKMVKN
jgi:hypothetical protein